MWGPILFTYCRVEYGRETRKLEITKGEFVGKCKPTRQVSLVEGSKSDDDPSIDDDDDDDEEHNNSDDVDKDDGQVPVDVIADNILPGLSLF